MKLPQPPKYTPAPFRWLAFALTCALLAGPLPALAQTPPAGNTTTSAPPTPAVNTAIIPEPRPGTWMQRHQGFVDLAKKGDIDLLFLGDSITDFWRSRGLAVWNQYYGSMKAANFGISADRTQHVLWRLQNGEGQGFKPKVIVLMIGTNNTGPEKPPTNMKPRNTVPEAIAGVTAVVQELRKDFPDAKILLLGLFPRGNKTDPQRQEVADINLAIAKLNDDQHIFYFYFGDKFLGPDGNIPPDLMPDKLHPSPKGYVIWAESIKEPLAKLLQ